MKLGPNQNAHFKASQIDECCFTCWFSELLSSENLRLMAYNVWHFGFTKCDRIVGSIFSRTVLFVYVAWGFLGDCIVRSWTKATEFKFRREWWITQFRKIICWRLQQKRLILWIERAACEAHRRNFIMKSSKHLLEDRRKPRKPMKIQLTFQRNMSHPSSWLKTKPSNKPPRRR
jgi:hypothetical protein